MSGLDICDLAYRGNGVEVKAKIERLPELAIKTDEAGRTALHWACSGGHREIVEFLLECSGDVDGPDDAGWTPLMIAASANRIDIVRLLLDRNASVNLPNENGQTALHYAASKSNVEVMKLLLGSEAEINVRDKLGDTPLHRCASKGNLKAVQLLLSFPRCDVDLANAQGNTALHLACEEDRGDEAVALIKHGADLLKLNKAEKSPLDLCPNAGLRRTLSRLAETG